MAFTRQGRQECGRALLETWVGEMLHEPVTLDGYGALMIPAKGLALYGLDRPSLLAAGLSHAEVDHLFRALYTFTVGFQDVLKDLLLHAPQRQRVLHDVWRAFLSISETAAKINFKSNILDLVRTQQEQSVRMAEACKAAADARADGADLEHMLAWLTGAHAQEMALHQAFHSEAMGLKQHLTAERAQHAVAQASLEAATRRAAELADDARILRRQVRALNKAKAAVVEERDSWRQKAERAEATLAAATQQVAALQAGVATEDAGAAPGEDDDLPRDAQDALLEQLGLVQGQVTGSGLSVSVSCIMVLQRLACVCSWQLAASLAQQETECEALRVGTVGGMHQRISGLSEELAQRSAQLADLQGSHADLQQQMAAATAQLEQGGTERRALQAAYEGKIVVQQRQQEQLQHVQRHSRRLETEQKRLEGQADAGRTLLHGFVMLRQQLLANRTARCLLHGRLDDLRSRHARLQRELQSTGAWGKEQEGSVADLSAKVAEAAAALEEQQSVNSHLSAALASATAAAAELQQQKQALQAQVQSLQNEVQAKQADLHIMHQTQVASDTQHADFRRKHLAVEAELQQEVAVLTQAKAVLSERLSELNAVTGKQSVDLLQTRAHLAQLQAVAQEQSKAATDKVHAMQYDVTTMQERLETAEASAAMLSAQLARKRQKKRLYKGALLQETADLQATIVDRDGRIADLNGRIDQLARIVKSLQQMNAAAIKATTGKAPELPAEATDLPKATPGSMLTAELAAQRADLEGRLAVCTSKLRDLDAAAAAEAAQDPDAPVDADPAARAQLEAARVELEATRSNLERQLRLVKERQLVASSKQEMEVATTALGLLESAVQHEQNAAVQSLQDTKQRLFEQLERMTKDRDKYRTESASLQENLTTVSSLEEQARSRISVLEADAKVLMDSYRKAEAQRSTLQTEIVALRATLRK
eukprot:jgi/Astpho2/994/Aster-x0036